MSAIHNESALLLLDHVRKYLQHTLGMQIGVCSAARQHWWEWEEGLRTKVLLLDTLTTQQIAPLKKSASPLLLVTEYVSPSLAEQLRAAGVCYADGAGNAWLRWARPRVLVLLQGFRRRQEFYSPLSAPIRSAQMRFLFQLLTGPVLSSYAPAALAAYTGVKPALIERFVHDLQQQGIWGLPAAGQHLGSFSPLVRAWVDQYGAALRNRLNPQRYQWAGTASSRAMMQQIVLPTESWWSGEVAASRLLGQELVPTSYTIYTRQPRPQLAEKLGLIAHSRGNVEILTPFFSGVSATPQQCVDPLLVYADLKLLDSSVGQNLSRQLQRKFLRQLL